MFNLDDITNENNEKQNLKWAYIPDHPYRMWIVGGSGSRKINALFNLTKKQKNKKKKLKWQSYWQDLFIYKRLEWTKISVFK